MKRNFNLDLIRSTAIILVLCQHFLTGSGVYDMNIVGVPGFAMTSLRVLFMCSVPLFLMLSGYLCNRKQFCFNHYLGLVRIYLVYLLSCAACLIFKYIYIYMEQQMDFRYIFGSIFNHYANDYSWYVIMYTGLVLLMPFLNSMYNGLPARQHKKALLISLIYLTVVPTICNIFIHIYTTWWTNLYPLVYYFAGAYICEYGPKINIKKGFLFLVILIILFGSLNYWVSSPDMFVWADYNYYAGFMTCSVSILLFLILTNIDMSSCPRGLTLCAEKLSVLSFNIYLFSYIPDTIIYDILRANVVSLQARLWFIPITVSVSLFFSLIIAWLVDIPVNAVGKAVCAFLTRGQKVFSTRVLSKNN